MIQRIQSIWLFLAFISSVLLLFFPLIGLQVNDAFYTYSVFGLKQILPTASKLVDTTFPVVLVLVLTAILSLYAMMQYKNRKWQMTLCKFNILLTAALVVLIIFISENAIAEGGLADAERFFKPSVILPLLSLIFIFLAHKGIKADEALVRSADRLR